MKYLIPLLMLAGCNYVVGKNQGITRPPANEAKWSDVKLHLIDVYCIRCHGAGQSYDLSTYTGTMRKVTPGDASKSEFCTYMRTGFMPLGDPKPSKDEIDFGCGWVDAGAKE